MTIEIECPPAVLLTLFDSNSVTTGASREVPGGATIRLAEPGRLEKRHVPGAKELLETIVITFGPGIAINLFSNWLYDKLKAANVDHVRINRTTIEVTAPDVM